MKLIKHLSLYAIFLCLPLLLTAQVPYTANTHTTQFSFPFGFGANLGVYPGWLDEDLAALIAGDEQKSLEGVSGNTLRPTLPENFLEHWGYDIRTETFDYYRQIGMEGVVAFVGFPSDAHRETDEHCPGARSNMFKNMYTPIWDNGENGTPVNDTNYYALYLYKTIQMYGDNVDIWEISNEPDLTGSPSSYQGPEYPDSWWNRDPTPCELAIKAPIQYYIRMLRISYEVIKSEQPDDFIALGGVGFPSFVDGLLRNTDNPDQGISTNEFPLKGGAYFDILSFHTYPHIDGSTREWSNDVNGFVYFRHSDRTVDKGYIKSFLAHKKVVEDHGYTGNPFPKKHFIVTETNIPSKQFGEYIGSHEAQRNYTMKVLLKSMEHGIHQVHFFTVAEEGEYFTLEFSHMGLYKKLGPNIQAPIAYTEQGIGFKTTALLTKGYVYDPEKTAELNLPLEIDGLALKNTDGKYIYALWAKTFKDRNESTSATYFIPTVDDNNVMEIYDWDYSITGEKDAVPGRKLFLTGTPRFFKPIGQAKLAFEIRPIIGPNPANIDFQLDYTLFDDANVQVDLYDLLGAHVFSILPKTYQLSGNYSTTITTEFLPVGTYVLKIKARQQTITQKIMVHHF